MTRPNDAVPTTPEVFEGALDRSALAQYFDDLHECADVIHVQIRGAGGPQPDRSTSLNEARHQFLLGDARMAQIRYRYQGDTWCDTLIARAEGVRLVRLRQDLPHSNAGESTASWTGPTSRC